MIYSASRNFRGISFVLFFFLFSCSENVPRSKLSSRENYVSNEGIEYEFQRNLNSLDIYLSIPENALNDNQFILVLSELLFNGPDNSGNGYFEVNETPEVLDSTVYKIIVSSTISFTRYNCTELKRTGKISILESGYTRLYGSNLPFGSNGFKDPRIKPYQCPVIKDLSDSRNWQEIQNYFRSDSSIAFEFTDLENIYFLGFDQP
jgi:hypothetical protein